MTPKVVGTLIERQTHYTHYIRAFGAIAGRSYRRPGMPKPDLTLLVALDVLLDEGSVAAAAKRLGLSPSAMSRTLARLREATGDPLLVRAGRGLVPTPRAQELAKSVVRIVGDAEALLRRADGVDLARLERTSRLRTRVCVVDH